MLVNGGIVMCKKVHLLSSCQSLVFIFRLDLFNLFALPENNSKFISKGSTLRFERSICVTIYCLKVLNLELISFPSKFIDLVDYNPAFFNVKFTNISILFSVEFVSKALVQSLYDCRISEIRDDSHAEQII